MPIANEQPNSSKDVGEISGGQAWLIDRMRAVGYKVTEAGMCYGITSMAVQAFLMGDMDKFLKRLHFIAAIPSNDFKKTMEKKHADERVEFKNGNQENSNHIYAKDIYAFFDGVALYQNPNFYREIFPTGMQKNNLAKELVNPTRKNAINSCLTSTGIYTSEEDVKAYLQCLQTHFSTIPISISFSTGVHAVSIHFNPENKTWLFLDPNRMNDQFEDNLESLSKKIMSCAGYQGCLHFSIVTNQTNSTVIENNVKNLQEDPVWNSLHKFTDEKNKALHKYSSTLSFYYGSYLGFICLAGDSGKVQELLDNSEFKTNELFRKNNDGQHFLTLTIRSGKKDLVQYIFEHLLQDKRHFLKDLLDSNNAYVSALEFGDTKLFDLILSYDTNLSREYFYNDIENALAVSIEKKDEKSIHYVSSVILDKNLFDPTSFLTIFSQLTMKDPLERLSIINNQSTIVKTGLELALVMHLLSPNECQSFLSVRNAVQPEIKLNLMEFARILNVLNPEKGLIFFQAFKDKCPEIFSTRENFSKLLRMVSVSLQHGILESGRDKSASIFKTEDDLSIILSQLISNKNSKTDFPEQLHKKVRYLFLLVLSFQSNSKDVSTVNYV